MPHIYETQITNEDNLKSVLNAIEHFNYDRLLYALQGRRFLSVADIKTLDAPIAAPVWRTIEGRRNYHTA